MKFVKTRIFRVFLFSLFAHFSLSPSQNSTWNLGFVFCCGGGTSSTRQKHADTGSGPLLLLFFDDEPGAVQRPESARGPSVPKSTVAGSGSSAPLGGGAWVSIRALASAAEAAEALFVFGGGGVKVEEEVEE